MIIITITNWGACCVGNVTCVLVSTIHCVCLSVSGVTTQGVVTKCRRTSVPTNKTTVTLEESRSDLAKFFDVGNLDWSASSSDNRICSKYQLALNSNSATVHIGILLPQQKAAALLSGCTSNAYRAVCALVQGAADDDADGEASGNRQGGDRIPLHACRVGP
eukprot:4539991-Pyramimonas_sp.AAC.1